MKSTGLLDSVNNVYACRALAHSHSYTHIFARAYKNPCPHPSMHAVTNSTHTYNKTEETKGSGNKM
jgi:hypothetical protein